MTKTLIFISAICSMWCSSTFGQAKSIVTEERISKISNTLSVSTEKAMEIARVLDYKKEEIIQRVKDNKLSPLEKRKFLEMIVKERQRQLKTLLTPKQIAVLNGNPPSKDKTYYDQIKLRQAKALEEGRNRNRAEKLKYIKRDFKKVG